MADKRLWFKVDVSYMDNPKVAELVDDHPRAIILHLVCIAWAKKHGTDGRVPVRLAMRQACAEQCDFDACVDAGLLIPDGDRHVEVHDYLKHQTSARQDQTASDKGRRAANTRHHGNPDGPSSALCNALGNASSMHRAMQSKSKSKKTSSEVADAPLRPDVTEVLDHLDERIKDADPEAKLPTRTKKNTDAARLLLDRDGRTVEQVKACIDFATNDEFWRTNIRSMSKLREKYDTLRGQAQRSGNVRQLRPEDDNPLRYWSPPEMPDDYAGGIAQWHTEQARLELERRGLA